MANLNIKYDVFIDTPVGNVGVLLEDNAIIQIDYIKSSSKQTLLNNSLTKSIKTQFTNYFKDPSSAFTLAILPSGTIFQKKVWNALLKIQFRETLTYGELAKQLNTSARAIGNACRNNPIPIIIPCHRIVSKKDIGGYSGKTNGEMLSIKRYLLKHEGYI